MKFTKFADSRRCLWRAFSVSLGALALIGGAVESASAQTTVAITNGSFEDGVAGNGAPSGWELTRGGTNDLGVATGGIDGSRMLWMGPDTAIRQDLGYTLQAGETLTLQYRSSRGANYGRRMQLLAKDGSSYQLMAETTTQTGSGSWPNITLEYTVAAGYAGKELALQIVGDDTNDLNTEDYNEFDHFRLTTSRTVLTPYAWYRADSGVSEDAGGAVSNWANQVGTGDDLGNVVGRPSMVALSRSGGGSAEVVAFDGSSSLWAPTSSWGSVDGNRTVVVHARVTAARDGFLFDGSTGVGLTRAQVRSNTWQAGVASSGGFANADTDTTGVTLNTWQTHIFTYAESGGSTQVTHYIDGSEVGTHSVARDGALGGLIIAGNGAAAATLPTQVAEVLVYNSALSASERSEVTTDLTARWGDLMDLPYDYQSAAVVQTSEEISIYGIHGVLALQVNSTGNVTPFNLTGLTFDLTGTTDLGDIEDVRLYSSPSAGAFDPSRATLVETLTGPFDGTLSFSTPAPVASNSHHFWVAVKLKGTSTLGDVLDGRITGFSIDGADAGSYVPTGIDPAGELTVNSQFFSTIVRKEGDDGSRSYRIPGLATSNDGTLIAVYDIRWNGSGDLPANIDVGVSRSTDGGFTWGPMITAMDFDGSIAGSSGNGVGDPSILVDRETGRIWCAALHSFGNNGWAGSGPGLTAEETGQFVLNYSDDDGLTWSEPVSITESIKDPAWRLYFNGPGKGICLRDGTLVFPAQYRDESGTARSNFIYSTDNGATWNHGAPAVASGSPWTTEAQMIELDNGDLLITMRNHAGNGQRAWATYSWDHETETIADGTWSAIRYDQTDPVVMASIERYSSTLDGDPYSGLLFANPDNSNRSRMSIRLSLDEGQTWAYKRKIDDRPAAYSCMTILPDGDIGIFYETGDQSSVAEMRFCRFPVEWVVGDLTVDTDGDGMPDFYEDTNGLNKNSAADATLDADSDGANNLNEYLAGTDPQQAPGGGNLGVVVSAGSDFSTIEPTATLAGSASDDGLPNPPAAFTTAWSVTYGPGAVTFADASSPTTDVTFAAEGTYVLRLTANDGAVITVDEVRVDYALTPPAGVYANFRAGDGVTADGSGTISNWADQSGNGRNLDQVVGAPSVSETLGLSGQSVELVVMDGDDSLWAGNGFGVIQGNRTIAVRARLGDVANGYLFDGSSVAGLTRAHVAAGDWQVGVQVDDFAGADPVTTSVEANDWQDHVFVFIESGGSTHVTHWIDGVQVGSHTVATDTSLSGLILGMSGAATDGLNVEFAEVLVYDRALDVGERDELQRYLDLRWAELGDAPMDFTSASVVQTAGDVFKFGTYGVAALAVTSYGNQGSYNLTGLEFDLSGTTDLGDIAEVRLYSTGGDREFSSSSATLIATLDGPFNGPLTFNASAAVTPGIHHFWVAVKMSGAPVDGDVIDARITGFSVDGPSAGSYVPSVTSPPEFLTGTSGFFSTVVRKGGDDGSGNFRIPAMVVSNAGTVIAGFDVRWDGNDISSPDLPANIDTAVMRSLDGGYTWEPMITVMDFDANEAGSQGNGVGDPTLLVDRNTGRIWCAALWSKGNRGWWGSGPGLTADETGQFMLSYSDDDGVTWSEPFSITSQVKDPAWNLYFNGPGKGICTREGTLVFPAQYKDAGGTPRSNFIYSTDNGATWVTAPAAIASGNPWTTESQIVELDNGDLLLSMRNHDGRKQRLWARFSWDRGAGETIADGSWSAPWFEQTDPTCMASVERYRSTLDGHPFSALLFSNPDSTAREKMSIRLSLDEGVTWPYKRKIDDLLSAYSCLAVMPDGDIGIFYETGEQSSITRMVFARFPLSWLVGDTDTDGDRIPDFYEDVMGLNKQDATDAAKDADGDGVSNLGEFEAQTDAKRKDSVLKADVVPQGNGFALRWDSVEYVHYRVEKSASLEDGSWTPVPGYESVRAAGSVTNITLPESADPRCFYRVVTQ
ncbi:exo-alpha-sialidase [Sulfuriroseicoccus oceanibius]|uniref:exo-alpha-sialidase n=1 Tax=Sulfuriroseicoccus oceanibius TaxID=2707525 RepID=A0A6B3LCM1_9BACT|nr:exo-alpha-sialidase [Sulfuriroseicoccus oceanibius]QQL45635.1 exo-alpha-sialidase [Sulfuriroseicoccus oceanibius]